ncbi:MAG: ATP-dependent protease ATPase subunit HslU [Rickettsiales bacterium]|jgi:ATP-dependent HslUV protease ATP-binding subunit HslU|nr:ATP-dependent protease ATPase subunit HslU [Rickettsiales bacterium]
MSLNKQLTPEKIVQELDKYIIGQEEAKKAVAIALRNRWRRKKLTKDLQEEVVPRNILMKGPTGVGKTEIARRLSKLVDAPFVKVEATKFTEVGYVGRDVESIIRDLVEVSINQEKISQKHLVKEKAQENALKRILDIITGPTASSETRDHFKSKILDGSMDNKEIDIEVKEQKSPISPIDLSNGSGASMGVINLSDMLGKALTNDKKKVKKLNIKEALEIVTSEEAENLADEDFLIKNAISSVENDGIVFIDEIDKIVVGNGAGSGKEVSREGVQRDLLPLLEGTSVTTKYGTIKTDHILFICAGAFHLAKPSDLLPELQGRLPIRVELEPLSSKDMLRILKEPIASLPIQYTALLETENVKLEFMDNGLDSIAAIASDINSRIENIGARRLQTIMEKVLEEVSFNADKMDNITIKIDKKFVNDNMKKANLGNLEDLSKFIL